MILNDKQIEQLCVSDLPMIFPYVNTSVKEKNFIKCISYGQSSFGYDIRLRYDGVNDFQVFNNPKQLIDPKDFDPAIAQKPITHFNFGIPAILPAHSFALTVSKEYFRMPEDVCAICLGKSTYARCGLIVNVTPLEPGWEGYLTIELSNTTNSDIAIYLEEGIAQLLFFKGDRPSVTYKDKKGKYQSQEGLTYAKV